MCIRDSVTSHDSTDGLEEFIATFTTLDKVQFDCNYLPSNTSQALLKTAALARSITNFELDPADQTNTLAFAAYVESWELALPVKGVQKLSITLKPSGVLTES